MKSCQYCGRENDDDAANCRECGSPFETAKAPAQSSAALTLPRLLVRIILGGILLVALCIVAVFTLGTLIFRDPPTPEKRADADWMPNRTHRARQMKWLPPSSQVEADQKQWLATNTNQHAMIYMARFSDPSRQSEISVEYERRSSPLGNPWWTDASYTYTDPTNGTYIIRYNRMGRHKTDFLKLDDAPRLHWFLVDQLKTRDGNPVLEVIGRRGHDIQCILRRFNGSAGRKDFQPVVGLQNLADGQGESGGLGSKT